MAMEALAALGVACNLMQVISFTSETITLCKHIYKRGSADPTLEGNAKILQVLLQSLVESCEDSTSKSPSDTAEWQLQELAKKCIHAATELSTELDKIRALGGKGSIGKTIIAVCKKCYRSGLLRRLQEEIQGYQRILESGLLVKLCTASEAATIQTQDRFKNLDLTLQHFIEARSRDAVQISQLAQSIEKRIEDGFLAIQDQESRRRILGSLKYDGMNLRRNMIKKHHSKTFEWIFSRRVLIDDSEHNDSSDFESDSASDFSDTDSNPSESESDSRNGDDYTLRRTELSDRSEDYVLPSEGNFVSWLRSDEKTFWISGKPGSGKSTLMLFLLRDSRTKANLNRWKANTRIISHFILSSGHDMQRNTKGIYCSMLHQLLDDDISREGFLLSLLGQKLPRSLEKDDPSDWEASELRRALKLILTGSTTPTCMFIDGLDELVASEIDEDLWSLLRVLQSIPELKICLSSRPEPTFKARLKDVPRLRIHDLTNNDIRTYATDFLKSKILPSRHKTTHLERDKFIRIICERSDGVFLWVYLVLRRLQRGVTNNDSIAVLNERLEQTPKELHDLFDDMWGRLGQDAELADYISTAANYFRLVGTAQERIWPLEKDTSAIAVPDLMLATDTSFLHRVLNGNDVRPEEIDERCESVLTNFDTRCAGLLECQEVEVECVPRENCRYNGQTHYHKLRVQFIHRTALDYLLSTQEGSKILAHDSSTSEERISLLHRVDVAVAKLWGFTKSKSQIVPCLTVDWFLNVMTGYQTGAYTHLLSDNLRRSLISFGASVYMDAMSRKSHFFQFYPNPEIAVFFGTRSPDFMMALCQSFCLGLVPVYLQSLDRITTPDYLGYLLICICSFFTRFDLPFSDNKSDQKRSRNLMFDVEFVVHYLVSRETNVNLRGISSLQLGEKKLDDLRSSNTYADTPVSILIRNLYENHTLKPLAFTLRMISTLLTSGAEMSQETVFSAHGSLSWNVCYLSSEISPERILPTDGGRWSLLFTTTPGYLLRLALSIFSRSGNSTKLEIPDKLIHDLLNHQSLPSNPDVPKVLAFEISTDPIDPRLPWCKIRESSQRRLQEFLVGVLERLVLKMWWPERDDKSMWYYLGSIKPHCEQMDLAQLESELAVEYSFTRLSDYLKRIPQLGNESQEILQRRWRLEAYGGCKD